MDWAHVACIFLACDFVLTQAATDRSVVYNDYMASFDRATPSLDSEQGSIRLLSSGLLGLSVINHAVELLTVKPCSAVAHYHPAVSQLIHVISGSFTHSQVVNGTLHRHTLHKGELSVTPPGVIHAVATACKEVKVLVVFSGHAISRTSPVSDLLAMPERTIRASFGVDDAKSFLLSASPPAEMIYPLDHPACPERCTVQDAEPATLKEGSCVSPGTDNAQQLNGFLDGAPSVVNNSLGVVQALTAKEMPALGHIGYSFFRVTLRPCSILLPHFHADAHEMVFPLTGTAEASMVVGGKTLQQHVTRGDVVTIPKGALHSFANPACIESHLYAVLTSSEPGMTIPAQELLRLEAQELRAAFGVSGETEGFGRWPEGLFGADDQCLNRCGTAQQ